MKRIFTFSMILAVTGLLLPACGVHMSVAKRQHSRGYYVAISSDKKHVAKQTDLAEVQSEKEKTERTMAPEKALAVHSPQTETAFNEVNMEEQETDMLPVQQETTEKTQAAKTIYNEPAPDKASSFSAKSMVEKQITKVKQTVLKDSKVKEMAKERVSGLSLFWIVILVLILLGVLGLIGGLGNIVYLAFVAALVCLILWLLGII